MIKSITNVLIIFFIFQQLKSQISQIDQNGVNPFCDETILMGLLCPVHCSVGKFFFLSCYNFHGASGYIVTVVY